jgi:hypothetical protein
VGDGPGEIRHVDGNIVKMTLEVLSIPFLKQSTANSGT